MGLFVFLLGAVSSLAVAFILLVNFLNKVEEKVQQEYEEAKKSAGEPDIMSVPLTDKKTQVQVEAVGSAEVPEWLYGIVRANMVFLFKTDLDVSASGVFCLDGCKVGVVKNHLEQSSPWHKKNSVQVHCPERNLYHQSKTIVVYCKTARELEVWYYALLQGANLSVKKDALAEQKSKKEQNYFKFLHTLLKNADPHQMPSISPSTSPSPSPSSSPMPSPIPSPAPSPAAHTLNPPPAVLSRSSSASGGLQSTAPLGTSPPSSSSSFLSSTNLHSTLPAAPKPESSLHSNLTWLNALLSRIFWNVHDAPDFSAFVSRKFNKKLMKIKKPSILKTVAICNVSFGPNLPMITSAHLEHISHTGELVVQGDILYHGGFTLTISIEIAVEVMGHSLSVPVMVTAHVTRLVGRAVVRIGAPPSSRLWFAFEREPTCDIDVDTSFGSAGKVANVPRLAKIIVNALKTELLKFVVLPNMEDFQLPKFKGQKGDKNVVIPTEPTTTAPATTSTPTPTPTTITTTAPPSTTAAATASQNATPTTTPPAPLLSATPPAASTSSSGLMNLINGTRNRSNSGNSSNNDNKPKDLLPNPRAPSPITTSTSTSTSTPSSSPQIDKKMIDEALEKLATTVQPQHL